MYSMISDFFCTNIMTVIFMVFVAVIFYCNCYIIVPFMNILQFISLFYSCGHLGCF